MSRFIWAAVLWGVACVSVLAAPLFQPLPSYVAAVVYGESFYTYSPPTLCKWTLSGKSVWSYGSEKIPSGSLFTAFDAVYLYDSRGVSQIDVTLGVLRWHRAVSEITRISHTYPYVVLDTPGQRVYVHPETGQVLATSDILSGPPPTASVSTLSAILVATVPTASVMTWRYAKTVLVRDAVAKTLILKTIEDKTLAVLADPSPEASVMGYIWKFPTLSILTERGVFMWPYVRMKKGDL